MIGQSSIQYKKEASEMPCITEFYGIGTKYKVLSLILLLFIFSPWSSRAQEYDYDEIVSQLEDKAIDNSEPEVSFGISTTEFNNIAYDLHGRFYNASVVLTKRDLWLIGLEVPYIYGTNTGVDSQEMGNILFKSRFNAYDIGDGFSLWVPFSVRIGQRGQSFLIASHHDTYRLGLDIDYINGNLGSSLGVGYQLRTLEEDPNYNIGDVIDAKYGLRVKISERFSAQGVFQWYRVQATQIKKRAVGAAVDWAALSPGLAFELTKGLALTSSVVFPVFQSGTPFETDLAFGEIYYPQTSRVSFAWGLGANF